MKTILSIILIVNLLQNINGQSHNQEWGTQHPTDRQVYREIIMKEYSILKIIEQNVTYAGHTKITYIKCTDQYVNGNGGYATLAAGGPGFNDVTINIKSQRNHGYNFIVEIFASIN